jgi:hypothetical protein
VPGRGAAVFSVMITAAIILSVLSLLVATERDGR